jgi:hypothetical protein
MSLDQHAGFKMSVSRNGIFDALTHISDVNVEACLVTGMALGIRAPFFFREISQAQTPPPLFIHSTSKILDKSNERGAPKIAVVFGEKDSVAKSHNGQLT